MRDPSPDSCCSAFPLDFAFQIPELWGRAGRPWQRREGLLYRTNSHMCPSDGTLTLSCTACSRFPHFSILYWLGNGSFIEHLPGRLWEGSTR